MKLKMVDCRYFHFIKQTTSSPSIHCWLLAWIPLQFTRKLSGKEMAHCNSSDVRQSFSFVSIVSARFLSKWFELSRSCPTGGWGERRVRSRAVIDSLRNEALPSVREHDCQSVVSRNNVFNFSTLPESGGTVFPPTKAIRPRFGGKILSSQSSRKNNWTLPPTVPRWNASSGSFNEIFSDVSSHDNTSVER